MNKWQGMKRFVSPDAGLIDCNQVSRDIKKEGNLIAAGKRQASAGFRIENLV